jgi:hypothetical protein
MIIGESEVVEYFENLKQKGYISENWIWNGFLERSNDKIVIYYKLDVTNRWGDTNTRRSRRSSYTIDKGVIIEWIRNKKIESLLNN